MASNYTENYGLCQWEAGDSFVRTEFNQDNQKIDAALKAVEGCNCQLHVKTYTGTGASGPVTHTFPYKPMFLVILTDGGGTWVFSARGTSSISGRLSINTYTSQNIVWNDRSVSIGTEDTSAFYCCNSSGSSYCLAALLDVTG